MSSSNSSIRRVTDDSRLRAFLSTHFDRQNFIKNLINEGKSEECLRDIASCLEDINVEIKGYISKHTDDLMSGMGDFANLSERYCNLSLTSKKLSRNAYALHQEASESYNIVKQRTLELERVHSTLITLRLLRQFFHAKNQLDFQLLSKNDNDKRVKSVESFDVRLLINSAKILSELESLLKSEYLTGIDIVSESASSIKLFSVQLRMKSQDRLLTSLKEKSQVDIANCLQIFFNLRSLPEILLFAIDSIVKQTIDSTLSILDLSKLAKTYPEWGKNSLISSATVSVSSNNSHSARKGTKSADQKSVTSFSSQSKLVVKELTHTWATSVIENVSQIQILQKVISKKEDPASHKKFLEILSEIPVATGLDIEKSISNSKQKLSEGNLMELYWFRLSSSLQDIFREKMKEYPHVAMIIYPFLQKYAIEANMSIQKMHVKDHKEDLHQVVIPTIYKHIDFESNVPGNQMIFDSLSWSYDELFQSLGLGRRNSSNNSLHLSDFYERDQIKYDNGKELDDSVDIDYGLIICLKPLKERYLLNVLTRANEPIYQMFPEVEGYTAAVPSKRDLQTFLKVLQHELVLACIDGEINLVQLVSKECAKSIELFLTKVEGMINVGVESFKIVFEKNAFQVNSSQEHNLQLIKLLANLVEGIDKLPSQVLKSVSETPGLIYDSSFTSSTNSSSSSSNYRMNSTEGNNDKYSQVNRLQSALQIFAQSSIKKTELLLSEQLLLPLVESMSSYVKSQMRLLYKEGTPTSTSITTNSNYAESIHSSTIDTSKLIQTLQTQFPELIRTYLQIIPNSYSTLINLAIEEMIIRVRVYFISVSCLMRPMNEITKLRITKDMTSLDQILQSMEQQLGITNSNHCPVFQEFQSFRRLLFIPESENSSITSIKESFSYPSNPPTKESTFSLPFIRHMRPSTVLGYLFAIGPTLLPLPLETTSQDTDYFDLLFSISDERRNTFKYSLTKFSHTESHHHTSSKIHTNFASSYRLLYLQTDLKKSEENLNEIAKFLKSQWRTFDNEKKCWEVYQKLLDIFVQRLSVIENSSERNILRKWYESLIEIGNQYFSAN